jgi:Na+(H+)/acetate symporter ActP
MYEKTAATIGRKAEFVTYAVLALGLAVILTVVAGIFFQ